MAHVPVVLLALLLIAAPASAGMGTVLVGGGVAPAGATGCATEQQTSTGSTTAMDFGNGTYSKNSGSFTANASYCLCKVTLDLGKVGSPTFSFDIDLYSNTSGAPDTKLVNIGTQAASGLTTTQTEYTYTLSTCYNLTNATVYHIVYTALSDGNASNYARMYRNTSGAGTIYRWDTQWNLVDSSGVIEHRLFQ